MNKIKIFSIVAILIIIIFLLNVFSKQTRNFFYSISFPFQRVLWRAGDRAADFSQGIFRARLLEKDRERLKLENQHLLAEIVSLKEIKEENRVLREALGIGLQKNFKLSLAQIVGKDISSDFILINKGSKQGISKNMPVITQEKVLVGKVSEVYNRFSKVMLISDSKSFFDAEVSGKDISGIVKGKGGLKIFLDFIPLDKEISEQDIVITSNLGKIFPEGLLVGKIISVKKSDVAVFQQAEIDPFFDLSEIEYLFIIRFPLEDEVD